MEIAKYPPRVSLQQGFTLIEIMVVLVILAILGTFVTLNVIGKPDEARVTKAKSDIRTLENALDLYRLDNLKYPTTDEGLVSLVPKYLKSLPADPWNNDYYYANPGEHGEIDVYSLGADGIQGGEDTRADIGNWME